MNSAFSLYALLKASKWRQILATEFDKPYMKDLEQFLNTQYQRNKEIYPPQACIFNAFDSTPLDKVKVVIIGQDPYHGYGQANGLSFSVGKGVRIPPSLVNIYKELQADCQIEPVKHGHLESWCHQGVLLLNSVLTVEQGQAASHQGKGWEQFTDAVIEKLNDLDRSFVFVLWGKYAQKKGHKINSTKHKIIESTHPSPLSAHRGFLGSKPFSKINQWLKENNLPQIDWQLPKII